MHSYTNFVIYYVAIYCTYITVLITISNIANPTPTTRPRLTPRNTVAKNTTIHISCALIETHEFYY